MNKKVFRFCLMMAVSIGSLFSSGLQAWDLCGCFCEPFGATAEVRVAYYHPSSHKVRRIYGDGWTDYQLELSKDIICGWSGFVGVNGFSRKGNSIGFDNSTRLSLVPINFGVKYDYTFCSGVDVFVGGGASYCFLNIHDNSDYVHKHISKGAWGGLLETGVKYNFCSFGYVSIFADYVFQEFSFHNNNGRGYYSDSYYHESKHIERSTLDMNGYKIGVGLGLSF